MPVQIIGNILGRGVYPALARLQADRDGFRRVWLESIERVALVSIPATIGLIVAAEPLVDVLLGPDWQPVVVPLQILALNGVVKTFAATAGEVFQAQHRPHLRLVIEGAHLALVIPAIVVGAETYGLNGVALAIVLVNAVTGIPAIWLVARSVDVGLGRFLRRPRASRHRLGHPRGSAVRRGTVRGRSQALGRARDPRVRRRRRVRRDGGPVRSRDRRDDVAELAGRGERGDHEARAQSARPRVPCGDSTPIGEPFLAAIGSSSRTTWSPARTSLGFAVAGGGGGAEDLGVDHEPEPPFGDDDAPEL